MINKVILSGRLTDNPELRYTASGIAMANFSLAVRRNYENSSGDRDTDFFNIIAWRKLAELCGNRLKRGDKPTVIGRIQVRTYTAADGGNRKIYEVIAEEIDFSIRANTGATDAASTESQPFGEGSYEEASPAPVLTPAAAEADDEQLMLF